jgi:hypothetical protein
MALIEFDPLHDHWYEQRQQSKWSEWKNRQAHMTTEPEAMDQWEEIFTAGGFYVEREVNGRHISNKTVRIDMLLHPRTFTWHGGLTMPIGFECKKIPTKIASAFGQAVDYTHSDFYSLYAGRYVHNPYVAIYTGPIERTFALAMGNVGVLNIVFRKYYGLCICLGEQRIWSEPGYADIPRVSLRDKFNPAQMWTQVGHRR